MFPLCAAGRLVFEDFLRSEYSEENLLFWLACEKYKKITREKDRVTAAKRIYAEFVQVDATRQVWLLQREAEGETRDVQLYIRPTSLNLSVTLT